jgi:hypothetical protein
MKEPVDATHGVRSDSGSPVVVPRPADSERLLQGVEQDLELLDELDTREQVPVFDRLHTSLADALAKTADTGAPLTSGPAPGSMPGPTKGSAQGRPGA